MVKETIQQATGPEEMHAFRTMCREYAEALGVDLEMQKLSQELAELPGKYAAPTGRTSSGGGGRTICRVRRAEKVLGRHL